MCRSIGSCESWRGRRRSNSSREPQPWNDGAILPGMRSASTVLLLLLIAAAAPGWRLRQDAPAAAPVPDRPVPDRKERLLRDFAAKLARSNAPFFGEATLQKCAKEIAGFRAKEDPRLELPVRQHYAELLMQFGRYDEAIEQLDRATALCNASNGAKIDRRSAQAVAKLFGLAWLRVGERANCVALHGPDSCLFPLKDGAIHVDQAGSEKAIVCFQRALELDPNDAAAAWLLNIAVMTLGRHPEGIPEASQLLTAALQSEQALPRHPDIAGALGLQGPNQAGGSILDDFDGDGRLDVAISSMAPLAPLKLFLQRRAGEFEEVSAALGLAGQLGGLQLFHFDADNDGRLDLLVQRGGWMGGWGELPNSLLMQQQDGTFLDRTLEAGIEISAPSQAAAMADVDLDGDLDLFLGYEGAGERYPSLLFLNRGDGTFEDGSRKWGLHGCGFVKGCAFGDYDRDGWPDLSVSTMNGPNHLYRNQGGKQFVDVARALKVDQPVDSFSSFFFDIDNDGWLDLYATAYPECDRTAAVGAWFVQGARRCETNRLYRNDGKGGFVDVTEQVGLDRVAFPMGSNFGDIDGDGFPDLYLSTGSPEYSALFPNVLYRNDGGKRFLDVSATTGTGHLQKGHGVSFGDLDGDGDQELFAQLGGALPDDAFRNACFDNPGYGHRWLTVRLVGVKSNRFGLGTRVRVRIAEPGGERDVYADGGGNSSFGGNSLQLELGLGAATRIVELEVRWPASRTTQQFRDVPLDAVIRVTEGAAAIER
ncbi:MAG: CRTAC1 family protein [Planctomycetes bacterium]|nr:CRTAC1 family protein [Planctomycetota bacterium]